MKDFLFQLDKIMDCQIKDCIIVGDMNLDLLQNAIAIRETTKAQYSQMLLK